MRFLIAVVLGSISNIGGGQYKCKDKSDPVIQQKVISGVIGAPSSVTSIQVANLLRLFKIPQVISYNGPRTMYEFLNICIIQN